MTDEELDKLLKDWLALADKSAELARDLPDYPSGYAQGIADAHRAVVDTLTRLRKK